MGGGSYDRDYSPPSRSSGSSSYSNAYNEHQRRVAPEPEKERKVKPLVDPKKRTVSGTNRWETKPRVYECLDVGEEQKTPIVIAFDVTRSRGDDVKIVYDKLPVIIGNLIGKGYVKNPSISFCAIGDATDGDKAPIQAGYFEADTRLDDELANIWLEGGGGGSGQESYELAAWLYANRSKLDCLDKRQEKGIFFFIGDEGFYPQVSAKQVKNVLGGDISADIDSSEAFRLLQEQYEVFFIYPKKGWRDRKADIDAEMRHRVIQAGGQYDNVEIRATLMWKNYNDLDLWAICPDGHKIYYNDKRHGDGWLDVDANGGGPTTRKPVENIRWPLGKAPEGHYKFFVHYFARHDDILKTDYTAGLEVNGDIQQVEGTISSDKDLLFEFDYKRDNRSKEEIEAAIYAGYDDVKIKNQWASVIPEEHILIINDPKAIADAILGTVAIMNGVDLDAYVNDMAERDQTKKRQQEIAGSLDGLSNAKNIPVVSDDLSKLKNSSVKKRGGSSAKRLTRDI